MSNQHSSKKKNANSKKDRKNQNAGSSRIKDVIFILIIGISLLQLLSLFIPALEWLKNWSQFHFGFFMYPLSALIIFLFATIFYHDEKKWSYYRRLISSILAWFALSGIFGFTAGKDAAGLFGRLNLLCFEKGLGAVGGVLINLVILMIAAVLMVNFSVFTYLKEVHADKKEERKAVKEEKIEQRELKKEQERLEEIEKRKERMAIVEEKRKIIAEETEDAKKRKSSADSRFAKQYSGMSNVDLSEEEETDSEDFSDSTDELSVELDDPSLYTTEEEENYSSENDDIFMTQEEAEEKFNTEEEKQIPPLHFETKKEVEEEPEEKEEEEEAESPALSNGKKKKPKLKTYKIPSTELLKKGNGLSSRGKEAHHKEINKTAAKLEETFRTFGVGVKVTDSSYGPSATRYELQPDVGVKVSRILSLQDDIKLSLAAPEIRIEAPIPGKAAIGIEVPNKQKQGVSFRDLLDSYEFRHSDSYLSFALGLDINGKIVISDIEKMPHLLIAGTTGSGKSVCVNTIILSVLYHAKPTDVKMILIDPKVVEFSMYNGIPHLLHPVVTDPKKASLVLAWAVNEMEQRYEAFQKFEVRGIDGYNNYVDMEKPLTEDGEPILPMPQILIIVDEFADLMMAAPKEVEEYVCRLAQKARAAGIHLVLATQSPRADVVTGLIKANMPSRIALTVTNSLESRIILDMSGAERLLGKGDMLYAPAGTSKPLRVQGAWVSDEEIRNVINNIKAQGEVTDSTTLTQVNLEAKVTQEGKEERENDPLFQEAAEVIIDKQKGSIGMLQRHFGIGFNRAARIMDQLSEAGIVGPEEGTKPRQILMNKTQLEEYLKQ